MKLFSERKGLTPVRTTLQKDAIGDALRARLWNVVARFYNRNKNPYDSNLRSNRELSIIRNMFWHYYFKRPLDESPNDYKRLYDELREEFMRCEWFKVYNFLQFFADQLPAQHPDEFRQACNVELEAEMSAYRFVGDEIADLTSDEEIASVEQALAVSGLLAPVAAHMGSALALLADREKPDYRNSVKESISAVESVCKLIANEPKAELGDALKELEKKVPLHGALKQAFLRLYGYTSDANGIRHALLEESTLTPDDAKFMLVACSSFVNYLVALAGRSGVKL